MANLRRLVLPLMATMVAAVPAGAAERTWFVQAGADENGRGSKDAPLDSLERIERVSRRGDRIVVLPSTGELDGGIALKRDQRLIGAGPKVTGREAALLPRVTNTDSGRLSGDAVVLADEASVRNLVIEEPARGGIYGHNASGVVVRGNDVSGHNTSCAEGFHIPPFDVPTAVPGVGIPISNGLLNGWAGIMVDADRGRGRVTVIGNNVHGADCGDGIDLRMSGEADYRARLVGNHVADLRQGEDLESVLAIGLQTLGSSGLSAKLDRNSQTNLGNEEDLGIAVAGADTEGVFINPAESSQMTVQVSRNRYTNPKGLGGFSGNGLEYVTMGEGSRSRVVVRDSSFSDATGDVIEQLGLGSDSEMSLTLINVVARDSRGFAGSGFGNTVLIPGNNADCLLAASGGAGNSIRTTVRGGELTNCANNGITFGSAVVNGRGSSSLLALDMRGTEISANQGANLRIGNETGLDRLLVKVEDSVFANNAGAGSGIANLSIEDLGSTKEVAIDFGGGSLGSSGGNCIDGGPLAVLALRYDVSAAGNWWGRPGGPAPGSVLPAGGAVDASRPLDSPPDGC